MLSLELLLSISYQFLFWLLGSGAMSTLWKGLCLSQWGSKSTVRWTRCLLTFLMRGFPVSNTGPAVYAILSPRWQQGFSLLWAEFLPNTI